MRSVTSALKTSSGVPFSWMCAIPVISIGEVNAASQPFCDGFAFSARYWLTTCCLTPASHASAVWVVGLANALPRSAKGSSIDGSVLKKSTPALNFVIWNTGGSGTPPGISTLRNTLNGPSSESAKRICSPMPLNSKPP